MKSLPARFGRRSPSAAAFAALACSFATCGGDGASHFAPPVLSDGGADDHGTGERDSDGSDLPPDSEDADAPDEPDADGTHGDDGGDLGEGPDTDEFEDTDASDEPHDGDGPDAGDDAEGAITPWSWWAEGDPCAPPPPGCSMDADCPEGAICDAGTCLPPADPATFPFGRSWSWVRSVQLVEEGSGADCCGDVDGDGAFDNGLPALLDRLEARLGREPGSLSWNGELRAAFSGGDGAWLVETIAAPASGCGPLPLRLWEASSDGDRDGLPDEALYERERGGGLFSVEPAGFGPWGSRSRLVRSALDAGRLRAEEGAIELPVRIAGVRLDVLIRGARLDGRVAVDGGGLTTAVEPGVDEGLRLSGHVVLDEILDDLDRAARECDCAGIDPDRTVLSGTASAGVWSARCDQMVTDASACAPATDGRLCAALDEVCRALPILGLSADIRSGRPATDGTSARDSISVGALLHLVAASVTDPVVTTAPAPRADLVHVPEDAIDFRIDVLANDGLAVRAPRTLDSAVASAGNVVLGPGALSLRYTPPRDWVGRAHVRYYLDESRETWGELEVRVDEVPDEIEAISDRFTLWINRPDQLFDPLANDRIDPSVGPQTEFGSISPVATGTFVGDIFRVGTDNRVIVSPAPGDQTGEEVVFRYDFDSGEQRSNRATLTFSVVHPAPVCGDGIADPWAEACDDGNLDGGDGCSPACERETCPSGFALDWPRDADGDGHGSPWSREYGCSRPSSPPPADDCDDSRGDARPGAADESGAACHDRIDNDCDGRFDCADTCSCEEVLCDDGTDDDGDSAIDCDDIDCNDDPSCVESVCDDGIDDDRNGDADCDDEAWCPRSGSCRERPCTDGADSDGDGLTDCDDPDCAVDPACNELFCADGTDNDGDGLTDCDDAYDCRFSCPESECHDGIDNDGDGSIDCGDPGCCTEQLCFNGLDDDRDGATDCLDFDCRLVCPESNCDDLVDNDGDLMVDCADPGCGRFGCPETWCTDGLDNDEDGRTDCDDGDCFIACEF